MGRTVPTFTNIIDSEISSWSKFRRGLRKEDQELFDDLFRAARQHLAENFYAMRTIPFESIIISIVLEQRKLIRQLERRLNQLGNETTKTHETSTKTYGLQNPRLSARATAANQKP
jgi:hypothetical protein